MAYLLKTDVESVIKTNNLDAILGNNDNIFTTAANTAVQRVKNYLFQTYDTVAIFSRTGSARDADLLQHTANIALYLLSRRLPADRIPSSLEADYADTMEWLKMVAKGDIALDLPRKTDDSGTPITTGFIHSSITQRGQEY